MEKKHGRYSWRQTNYDEKFLANVKKLETAGLTEKEIAEKLNLSTVDLRLAKSIAKHGNNSKARKVADILREQLQTKSAIDIGHGVEDIFGVSSDIIREAAFLLETEGYNRLGLHVKDSGEKSQFVTIVARRDITQQDLYEDTSLISSLV